MAARRPSRSWLVAVGLAAVLAANALPARAGGSEDGERGLTALQNGDYRAAVRLFTQALEDRRLVRADRALAYVSRGKAWLALHENERALADFGEAMHLEPGDVDAAAALKEALNQAAPSTPTAPGPSGAAPGRRGPAADPWGLLAAMAGRYYWYEAPGDDPHAAYLNMAWVTQGEVLSAALREKSRTLLVGMFRKEAGSGRLIEASVVQRKALYATADATATGLVEYGYENGTPVRIVSTLQPDGSISASTQAWRNAAWRDYRSYRLVEVSRDELIADGIIKAK